IPGEVSLSLDVRGPLDNLTSLPATRTEKGNSGNVSLRLLEEEVKPFAADFCQEPLTAARLHPRHG
ncbi:hypothetical protein MNC86_23320, partial [Pantoea agglomerans]|nr:hypothetical protein [Pantoea agglomerans]